MLTVLVAGLAVIETASIVFTYISVSGRADEAAAAAAGSFASTRDQRAACQVGADLLHRRDPAARFLFRRCRVHGDGTMSITIRKEASTLLVQRIGFLDQLGVVTQTSTKGPPSL